MLFFYFIAFIIAICSFYYCQKEKSKRTSFIYSLCIFFFLTIAINFLVSPNTNITHSKQNSSSTYLKPEEKEQAKATVMDILNHTPQRTDEVEKATWFQSWGTEPYGPQDNIYWRAKVDQNKTVQQYLKFVTFSDFSFQSVFWRKLTFSTNEGNWDYYTESGVHGDGKNTLVVHGGKYEILDVKYDNVEKGIKILVEGTNPIIRYSGMSYYQDYRVPPEVIQELKRAVTLHENLKKLNYSLK